MAYPLTPPPPGEGSPKECLGGFDFLGFHEIGESLGRNDHVITRVDRSRHRSRGAQPIGLDCDIHGLHDRKRSLDARVAVEVASHVGRNCQRVRRSELGSVRVEARGLERELSGRDSAVDQPNDVAETMERTKREVVILSCWEENTNTNTNTKSNTQPSKRDLSARACSCSY